MSNDDTTELESAHITAPQARLIANGIWWSNFWQVAGICGIITFFTVPISVYAYSTDKGSLEAKIDYLIEVVQDDVKEIKVALADEKKSREQNDMEIRDLITTLGAR